MNVEWQEAIEYMVYTDMSTAEIAKTVGKSGQTIYNWRNNPEFQKLLQEELDRKTKAIRNRFKKDIDHIYSRVYDIAVNSENEAVALRAGQYILDQTLGKANSSIDVNTQQKITSTTKVESKDILEVFDKQGDG